MNFGDMFFSVFKAPFRWYFELKLNTREKYNEAKSYKGPLLMVGPHVALEDSLIAIAYRRTLIRFLASDANWDIGFRNAAFKLFNVIPFKRQRLDVKAIRKLKQTIDEGHSVGLFPEGQRTWDGKTLRIIPSITKLIKLLGVPVYNITYGGLYLTRPRWACNNTRKGRIDVNIRKILSKEEIKASSNDELLTRLSDELEYNEFDWQRKAMVPFKGENRAEFIELLLYKCPSCGAVSSLHSSKDYFSCDKCGAKYHVNEYGFIEGCEKFDNTVDWHAWQSGHLNEILNSDYCFEQNDMKMDRVINDNVITDMVTMVLLPGKIDIMLGNGERIELTLKDIRSCDAVFSDAVEFYVDNTKYRFLFEPKKNHMSLKLFEDMIIASYQKKLRE